MEQIGGHEGMISERLLRRRQAAQDRRRVATPRHLRLLSIVIAASAIALTLIGAVALIAAEVTAVGIQQRTVPSIVGMQRIHAWLADADRSAANAYLAGGSEVTLSELQYQADIAAATKELQLASEHNPAGGDTSERLQTIAAMVAQYVGLIQTANVEDRLGIPVGTVYLQAGTGLMHAPGTGILARVDALRELYSADLDRANRTLQITAAILPVYAVAAIVLLGLLVYVQRFVRRRFRRRRSPRLLAATLLLVIVAGASGLGAVQAGRAIHDTEDHAYVRLLNLWTARSLLYDANGNESLSLISRDTAGRAAADQAFQAETRELVDTQLTDSLVQDAQRGVIRFGGRLADELRSATNGAERAAAVKMLVLYRKFMDVDAAVRAKAQQGNLPEAIALTLGTDQGQLTFAFADVDWYMGIAIQQLRQQFDDTMTTAERLLGATIAIELLGLAIVALTFWAVQPRIDEFRLGGPRSVRAA